MKDSKSTNVEFLMKAAGISKPIKVFYHACEDGTTGYYHCNESNKLFSCWKEGNMWVSDDNGKTWSENSDEFEYEKFDEWDKLPTEIEFIGDEDIPNLKQGLHINKDGEVDFTMVINFQ